MERGDGRLHFEIETGAIKLETRRGEISFRRPREIVVAGEKFNFRRGEKIRLFFSYRYTPVSRGETSGAVWI